jgi:hypothetical protein
MSNPRLLEIKLARAVSSYANTREPSTDFFASAGTQKFERRMRFIG